MKRISTLLSAKALITRFYKAHAAGWLLLLLLLVANGAAAQTEILREEFPNGTSINTSFTANRGSATVSNDRIEVTGTNGNRGYEGYVVVNTGLTIYPGVEYQVSIEAQSVLRNARLEITRGNNVATAQSSTGNRILSSPSNNVTAGVLATYNSSVFTVGASQPLFIGFFVQSPGDNNLAMYLDNLIVTQRCINFPTAPTVSNATPTSRCGTGTVTLTMSGAPANGSYRWYTAATGGIAITDASNATITTPTFTTPSITAGNSLTYYVSTRSAAGCESTRTPVTATANAIPAAPAAQGRERCGPGTVTLAVSNPSSNLTYRWYDGAGLVAGTGVSFTTPSLTSSTTYYLAAVGAGNCESATRTAVTAGIRPAPVAAIQPEESQCDNPGGNNVFGLDGTALNGNYVWEIVSGGNIAAISNTNTLSPQVTVTQAGTVTVRFTVTSLAPGCEPAVDEIELVVNELPAAVASTNVRGGEVCGSGRVTLSIIEPAENITYRWYEAATGGEFLGEGSTFTTDVLTTSDVFYVAAVSSAGCESDPRVAVSATVNPLPQASIAAETPQCENTDGPTLFALTGTIANGTFVWEIIEGADIATLLNDTSPTPTVSVSEPGTVRVRLTVSSEDCGDATAEVALVVNLVPDALTDANVEDVRRCGPGAVTLVASGAPEGVSYRWYTEPTGGNLVFTGASFATPSLTASTTYYVAAYIPATATTGCESDSRVPVTAIIEAVPVATIRTETPQCDNPGGVNVFGITGTAENGTFTWEIISGGEIATISGENTLAPQVTVTQPGTVRIQLTVANQGSTCSPDVEVLDLVVTPLPEPLTAENVNGAERCGPGNVTLTASGAPSGVSYRWYAAVSGGQVLDSDGSFTVSVSQTTTYYVAAVSNNCESTSRVPVVATVNPLPIISAGPDQRVCPDGTTTNFTLAGSISSEGAPAAAIDGIVWSVVSGTATITTNTDPLRPTVAVTGSAATIRLTVTSEEGCVVTDDVILMENPLPTAIAGSYGAQCVGADNTTLFTLSNGSITNGTPSWSIGTTTGSATATIVSGANTIAPQIRVTGTGTVSVTLTATSNTNPACGTATSTTVLTVNPLPLANAGTDEGKCATGTATAFTLDGTASNGTGRWAVVSSTGGATATITNPTQLNSNVTVNGTGTVTLRLTTTSTSDPACGTATDDVVLRVNPVPTAIAGAPQEKCTAGATTPFTLAGSGSNGTFLWRVVETTGGASVTIQSPTQLNSNVTFTGTGTATLELTTTSNTTNPACGTASNRVVLTVYPLPIANAGGNRTVCSGQLVTLGVPTVAGYTYRWSPTTDLSSSTVAQPTVTINNTGTTNIARTYTVEVTANGCISTSSATITVTPTIANNTVSAAQTICSGATPATLTGSTPTRGNGAYTYLWQSSTTSAAAGFGDAVGANTAQSYSPGALSQTTWFRRIVRSGGCAESISPAVQVTVTPITTYTLVLTANPFPVCQGGGGATYTATVLRNSTTVQYPANPRYEPITWTDGEDVSDLFTFDWWKNDINDRVNGQTGRTISQSGLSSTDYYTVRARPIGTLPTACFTYNNNPALIPPTTPNGNVLFSNRIYLGTTDVTVSLQDPGSICPGTSVTFTASPNAFPGTLTYRWTVNGQPTGTTGTTFTSSTLDNGDVVAVNFDVAEGNNCGTTTSTNSVTMVVVIPQTVVGGSYCQGTTGFPVSIQSSQEGVSYQLVQVASDGSTTNVGTPLAGTGSTLAFAAQTVGTYSVVPISSRGVACAMFNDVAVTETPLPEVFAITSSDTRFCAGSGVTIGLTGSEAGIKYDLLRSGTQVATVTRAAAGAFNFTGSFTAGTYTVRASTVANQPTTAACPVPMQGSVTITENALPAAVIATGGSYCSAFPDGPAATGTTVSVSGTQSGISYQLVNASGANIGSAVVSTGGAITFGPVLQGTYSVVATNPSTTCFRTVASNIVVTETRRIQPTGDIVITNEVGTVITPSQLETGQFARFTATTTFGDANPGAVHTWDIGTGPESDPTNITWNRVDGVTGPVLTIQDIPGGAFAVRVTVSGDPNVCYNFYTATYSTEVAVPLPVELIYLRTFKQGNNVLVEWATASEEGNAGFEVQVSENGLDFRKLDFVKTKNGNAMTKQVYQYVDKENGKHGTRYYRLKQIDESGTFEYFGVSVVNFGEVASLVKAFPNPFNTEVTLDIAAEQAGNVQVTMYNAAGRKMLERTIRVEKGFNTAVLEISPDLPHGIYFVRVILNGQLYNLKLLKQ